jgi:NAD(P)-dependent dehydrogenase (short-subunit alcohol dehydrogenase family)
MSGSGTRLSSIVITGAAQGIGQAIAESFASDGVRVAGLDVNQCDETEKLCGPTFRAFQADVADSRAVQRAFQEIDEWLRRSPDALCNVAATYAIAPFLETPLDAFDRVMAVNVRGPFICSQEAARRMREAGRGTIINITSTESEQAFALASVYGASKAALTHLTKGMAVELARYGIAVNAVAPGAIRTRALLESFESMPAAARHDLERTPLGRWGEPEDIVVAVRFLAYDATWMTGQTICVDGGFLATGLPMLSELDGAETVLPS